MSATTFDRLRDVLRNIFFDLGNPTPLTSPSELEEWDSLAHVQVVNALESEFGIKFELGDFEKIETLQDLVAVIERRKK